MSDGFRSPSEILPDAGGRTLQHHTETRVANIGKIRCHAELDGYVAQAKLRGIRPEELRAIERKRKALK